MDHLFPHDFAVPSNNHQDDIARSIQDLTTTIQHRYLHTPLQPVGEKQFAAIQALENIFCPNIQQQATEAPINPPMEPQEIAPLSQQIQQYTSVDLSPTLQELPGSNGDGHRYPTRYSLKKNSYSMACTSKYSYAAEQLAKIPVHPIHFKQHMACPVINPDTGVYLGYCHLIQGPDKDIWVKALANDLGVWHKA